MSGCGGGGAGEEGGLDSIYEAVVLRVVAVHHFTLFLGASSFLMVGGKDQGGDTRRQALAPGEAGSKRAALPSAPEKGEEEGGALPGPCKRTSSGPLVAMVLPKLSETVSMRPENVKPCWYLPYKTKVL